MLPRNRDEGASVNARILKYSDDLTICSACFTAFRLSWLSLTVVFFVALQTEMTDCSVNTVKKLELYYNSYVCIALYLLMLLDYLFIFSVSLKGSIVDRRKRRSIVKILYILLVLMIVNLFANSFATYMFFFTDLQEFTDCNDNLYGYFSIYRIQIIASWVDLSLFFCCSWFIFGGKPTAMETTVYNHDDLGDLLISHGINIGDRTELDSETSSWAARCKWWSRCAQIGSCNLFGGVYGGMSDHNKSIIEVGMVLARVFKGLDVTASDFIAALFLLRAEQRSREDVAIQHLIRKQLQLRNASQPSPVDVASAAPSPTLGNVNSWLWSQKDVAARADCQLHIQHVRGSRFIHSPSYYKFSQHHPAVQHSFEQLSPTWQQEEQEDASANDIREALYYSNQNNHVDMFAIDAISELEYYSKYMLGVYGWKLLSFMQLVECDPTVSCATCRMPFTVGPCEDYMKDQVNGDNCCGCEFSALRQFTGLREKDIIYLNCFNYVGQTVPYAVMVDHHKKAVVLSIRGSMSIADCITDVMIKPESLLACSHRWGFDDLVTPNSSTHSGFLKVSEFIREDLEHMEVLHKLLHMPVRYKHNNYAHDEYYATHKYAPSEEAKKVKWGPMPDCRGYQLVVVGHSLGASLGCVISLMLKASFPDLKVIAYSPPGCTFDLELANLSEKWIFSCWVGKDLFPRTCWHNIMKLRAQVLEMLRRCKVNKKTAFLSVLRKAHAEDLLFAEHEVPHSPERLRLAQKIKELAREQCATMDRVRLYAPGKLMHLSKTQTVRKCCASHSDYIPMWVEDRTTLDEFLVSSRGGLDHLPNYFAEVIRQVASEYCSLPRNISLLIDD